MANQHQLFVYGSLRQSVNHPAFQFISRYFRLVAHARIKGLVYDLGEYPAAIHTSEEKFIIGELYTIKLADEFSYAIAQLDDYEGLFPEEDAAPLYRREEVEVFTPDGSTKAWVYWYNGSIEGATLVEGGDVLEYMQAKGGSGGV